MSDLILLCAGALADRSNGPATGTFEAAAGASLMRLPDPSGAILRGARIERDDQNDALVPDELPHETWLRHRFSVPPDVCIEACALAEHGLPASGWRLTPVHIQVGHDRMRLIDPDQLALSQDEALRLAEAAAPSLMPAGFTIETSAPLAWLMHGEPRPRWHARAWTLAVGRSIDAYLPSGDDARLWRRLFTEVQMTWHDHPVNTARVDAGLLPVNAVWLDGWCGPLRTPAMPSAPAAGSGQMVSADAALRGLARLAGWRVPACADPLADGMAALAPGAHDTTIVDIDVWRRARRNGDAQHWQDGWVRFAEYLDRLAHDGWPHGTDRLRLVMTGERRCLELTLSRRARWQPWRRIDAHRLILAPAPLVR